MGIFEGLDDVIDQYLQVDKTWAGRAPRYRHRDTLKQLCGPKSHDIDGVALVKALYEGILLNWSKKSGHGGLPSEENWRFEKRLSFQDKNRNPETLLERTISRVVDGDNWANQVPVDSGLLGGRAHWIDLVFRAGTAFSLIELKYEANTPLSAAVQILKYGMVYAFFRTHYKELNVNLDRSPILQACEIHLRVLAPAFFFTGYGDLHWFQEFEKAIDEGVNAFIPKKKFPKMSFGVEAFPSEFNWTYETPRDESTQKEVLWAVHRRKRLFGT